MGVRIKRKQVALAAVLTLLAGFLSVTPPATGAQANGFDTRFVDITTTDAVTLKAMVMEPGSPGPHPVAILIGAWGGGMTQNIMPAKTLAEKGYVVISYGTRGFGESGGEVQVAGKPDLDDVSTVIDWTLGNTASDPARIGVGGVSYGAGIGLLAAGTDPRIRAVASLSGWADLVESLNQNDTRHGLTALILHLSGKQNGHLSPESDAMLSKIYDPELSDADSAAIEEWAKPRSPINRLDEINRNNPAVLTIQTWSETVFHPGQIVDLYHGLTGPRRAEFLPGDHAATESGGLLGLPSEVWNSVNRWFDAHVAGTDDSITREPPIQVTPRPGRQAPEQKQTWESAIGTPVRSYLGPRQGTDGTLDPAPPPDFATMIQANRDTIATGGVPLATYTLEALSGVPPTLPVALIDRENAAVWNGPAAERPTEIRGSINAHLTLTPPAPTGTVVAYVYDVDPFGTARLVNYLPHTWRDAMGDVAVDLEFSPTAYTVDPGHHLSVVVDSKDPLFIDSNTTDGRLGFVSTRADPSWIDIPTVS